MPLADHQVIRRISALSLRMGLGWIRIHLERLHIWVLSAPRCVEDRLGPRRIAAVLIKDAVDDVVNCVLAPETVTQSRVLFPLVR